MSTVNGESSVVMYTLLFDALWLNDLRISSSGKSHIIHHFLHTFTALDNPPHQLLLAQYVCLGYNALIC